ncbi:hypothetical protein [Haladaptatus sp. DYF46]|uniref:DUF7522 family protein n=1 Tax=Haladaptatus sp. DYF46 TaxID=2886041 RepID=UPI001E3BAEA8|nr:hypothetical protein [Haladaptatus sp. DYF46]
MSTLADATTEKLIRACRTQIGDELRSLTYFTPDEAEHLYLRDELERGDKLGFIETERRGFNLQRTYNWSELGEYNFTLRDFDNGYLVRVIANHAGLYLTTDSLTMTQFEEVTSAVKPILAEAN